MDTTDNKIISARTESNVARLILQGAGDAFVEYNNISNLAYKPELVINNYEQGQKVLSIIDRELMDCNEFSISVAFITESGVVPLLQTMYRTSCMRKNVGYL